MGGHKIGLRDPVRLIFETVVTVQTSVGDEAEGLPKTGADYCLVIFFWPSSFCMAPVKTSIRRQVRTAVLVGQPRCDGLSVTFSNSSGNGIKAGELSSI